MARTKRKVRREDHGSPHDGLFHLAFSVPRHAASELKTLLPSDVVDRIHWDKLRRAPDKFVDGKLTNRYSDILFEVEIDDEGAFIYVLYEHKSESDKWTLLQILEYMVRIWRAYLRQHGDKPGYRLPVILPVVLHHGAAGWTAPRRFIEHFSQAHESLRAHVPDFTILLDDVGKANPAHLLSRPLTPEAKLVLLSLLLGRTPERFLAALARRPDALRGTWAGADRTIVIEGILVYMEKVSGVSQEDTVVAMQQMLRLSPAEEVIFAHEIRARQAEERGFERGEKVGEKVGEKRGKKVGEAKGAAAMLSKLLVQRFGPLPADVVTRIQSAKKPELEQMGLRLLSASTLEEVLGKRKAPRK